MKNDEELRRNLLRVWHLIFGDLEITKRKFDHRILNYAKTPFYILSSISLSTDPILKLLTKDWNQISIRTQLLLRIIYPLNISKNLNHKLNEQSLEP